MGKFESKIVEKWIDDNLSGCENPRFKGRPLGGDFSGSWRYVVRDVYRVIAEINDSTRTIEISKIGHRSEVYETWILFLMG
jgi:mRNA interferase RelE/StbE